MNNKLDSALAKISEDYRASKAKGKPRAAIMGHVVLGYPTLKESIDLVKLMADSGVSLIELQIPFSDPMADGPTIMHANEVALKNGVTPQMCMRAAAKLSKTVSTPLLFMTYFNIVFNYGYSAKAKSGLSKFCADASKSGISGLIVPDVSIDDRHEGYWTEAKRAGLYPIPLVTPVTELSRMRAIKKMAGDSFVYCVSTTGTTGVRRNVPSNLKSYSTKVRKVFNCPLAVGFGLSTGTQVREVGKSAEIAVVGSATIDLIRKTSTKNRRFSLRKFFAELSN
jgi:tryptophan synthase alpha subunit